nr:DNA repair helicase XPB1 [Tanacetum cinerariifolium]
MKQKKAHLIEESNVQPINSPITIFGDIHGQFHDLMKLFLSGGHVHDINYIFKVFCEEDLIEAIETTKGAKTDWLCFIEEPGNDLYQKSFEVAAKKESYYLRLLMINPILSILDTAVRSYLGKGYGFVQFANRSSAEEAIQNMHGTLIGKQTVCISWGKTLAKRQVIKPVESGETSRLQVINTSLISGALAMAVSRTCFAPLETSRTHLMSLCQERHKKGYIFSSKTWLYDDNKVNTLSKVQENTFKQLWDVNGVCLEAAICRNKTALMQCCPLASKLAADPCQAREATETCAISCEKSKLKVRITLMGECIFKQLFSHQRYLTSERGIMVRPLDAIISAEKAVEVAAMTDTEVAMEKAG